MVAVAAALRKGKGLEEAGREQGLAMKKSAPFARGATLPPPLSSSALQARAFELKAGQVEPEPFAVPSGYVFVALAEALAPARSGAEGGPGQGESGPGRGEGPAGGAGQGRPSSARGRPRRAWRRPRGDGPRPQGDRRPGGPRPAARRPWHGLRPAGRSLRAARGGAVRAGPYLRGLRGPADPGEEGGSTPPPGRARRRPSWRA